MYIKQIVIQGFKSYKDQNTIEPFSSKHNVIVGRNGSGKSNFFSAIRFVLGDAYQNLSKEERQALLHEGVGTATISAFVEIIFNNSDNRFPTGKNEVILRRSIGLTLDEYSLDRKSVTKADVRNLLESAGFSRSNPYYIVPQGRVTSLTTAKDEDRLKLLKEVAGTRVYEEKREESSKLLEDAKRSKIEEVLKYIEERLNELEAEKVELSEYQELDNDRRSIEYTIYAREQSSASHKLEELEEDRRRVTRKNEQIEEHHYKLESKLKEEQDRLRDAKQTVQLHDQEKKGLLDERNELMKVRARLELLISELQDSQISDEEYKANIATKLGEVEDAISQKQSEVNTMTPQYTELNDTARQLKQELRTLEAEQEHLRLKQARLTKFSSKQERDNWLNTQIADITENLTIRQGQLNSLIEEKKLGEENLLYKTKTIEELKEKNSARYKLRQEIENEEFKLKTERDDATEQRKSLWREEAKLDTIIRNFSDEIRKAERILSSTIDRNTSIGLSAVTRIVREHNISGVYGPVFDLFECDPRFTTALDATAGASLFNVIVDTDQTASKLLELMSKEKAGRVTFIPLNRVKSKAVTYPNSSDAIPIITKLNFDSRFKRAFEQIFANTIVCPNLEVATSYVKSHRLIAVTLDGSRVDNRGALTGGYVDSRRSRLDATKRLKELQTQSETEKVQLERIKEEIVQADQKVTRIISDLHSLELRKKKTEFSDQSQTLENRLRKDEELLKIKIATKARNIESIQTHGQLLEKQLVSYQNELSTGLTSLLSSDEKNILDGNTVKIEDIRKKLTETAKRRAELENHIEALKEALNSEVLRKKDLLSKKERVVIRGSSDDLNRRNNELRTVTRRLVKLTKRIEDLDTEVDQLLEEDMKITEAIEVTNDDLMKYKRYMSDIEKDLERNFLKRSLLTQKKEECNSNIRDLGVLPDEAFQKYNNYRIEKLLKRLHKINEKLKKYNHVNKKAFEQYGRFTKQRDQLNLRKEELDKSGESISELIESLDRRKNQAIQRTFDDVAANFSQIFESLVPSGRGKLIIKADLQQDVDMDGNSAVDRFSGVSINVSFNSKSDEGLIMQQLSGGQKSLVALALIFAIQKCDPAPFYLFDEIDANLDAQYRTAVADMIHSLSDKAQFITTTFRPELLTNADKFYGVAFQGKVSRIHAIAKESALEFVEQEQQH
ncbi:RecF/RecN/SMC [Sporodiniella umbellata]|nr:RecF/RecN/SMC [Sporodiniella umbellata]